MRILLIVAIIFFVFASSGNSEKAENKTIENIKRIEQSFEQNNDKQNETIEPSIIPDLLDVNKLDDKTKEKYLESLREYFSYRISGYQHREKVFEWQLYSSKIIFIIVIFLVLVGIYFSGVQFHRGLKNKNTENSKENVQANQHSKSSTNDAQTTKFEATLKGIKVSSPVLGVIILVISLLFFYLYLVYVYPIVEIF